MFLVITKNSSRLVFICPKNFHCNHWLPLSEFQSIVDIPCSSSSYAMCQEHLATVVQVVTFLFFVVFMFLLSLYNLFVFKTTHSKRTREFQHPFFTISDFEGHSENNRALIGPTTHYSTINFWAAIQGFCLPVSRIPLLLLLLAQLCCPKERTQKTQQLPFCCCCCCSCFCPFQLSLLWSTE